MTVTFAGLNEAEVSFIKLFVGKGLEAVGQKLAGTNTAYTNSTQLPTFLGQAATAQQGTSAQYSGALQQLFSFMTGTGTASTAGAVALQATKTQMQSIAATATSQGFSVWPTGVVTPGPRHIARCAAHWNTWGAAQWRIYEMQAANYTTAIGGTVAQANAIDQQLATALIKVMTDSLGTFLQKKLNGDTGAVPAVPPTTTLPGTVPGTAVTTPAPGLTAPAFTATSLPTAGLAGATVLGGGAPALGGVGSVGAPGVPGAVSLAGGAAGAAGVLGVGAVPAAGGGAVGARGGMAGGMMPMGGAAGHRGAGGDRTAGSWLNEDENPWTADDAPEGVVA